jgi:hypothetical protein
MHDDFIVFNAMDISIHTQVSDVHQILTIA